MMIFIFNMGGGCSVNVGKEANIVPMLISSVSPIRYGTEMLLRRVLQGKPWAEPILIQLGYTQGDYNCLLIAATLSIVYFSVGWINLIRTNSHD